MVMEVMIVACVDMRKLFVKLRVGRLVILGVEKCLGLTDESDELCLQEALRMEALIFMKKLRRNIVSITWINQSGSTDEECPVFNIRQQEICTIAPMAPLRWWNLLEKEYRQGLVHGSSGQSFVQTLGVGRCEESSEEGALGWEAPR
jgi:hypothetical protein